MYSNIKKISRITTVSDLLERRQRNKFVNFHSITDPAILQQLLVKQTGTNPSFFERSSKLGSNRGIIVKATSNGGLIGSFKIDGYTLGAVTPAEINAFKQQFALKYGISANLITIILAPGSLVVSVSLLPIPDISELSPSDKSFLVNSEAIIRSIQPPEITECISAAGLSAKITQASTLIYDAAYTIFNSVLGIVQLISNDIDYKKRYITNFLAPFVGDPINNCMYTVFRFSASIVCVGKIRSNGSIDRICNYPENAGAKQILINIDSTYLIIPHYTRDTLAPNTVENKPFINKIYLINIQTGAISTITLTDLDMGLSYGFDQSTRRLYYSSAMNASRYLKLCYVTIPVDYSSATLSATYFMGISVSAGKIEFVNSTTGYVTSGVNISLIDLSTTNGTQTLIAGFDSARNNGSWAINTPLNTWYTSILSGPFLNAPNGLNAWFSLISDISYDSANNRLLVVDSGSQRIRSIDLRPGNNYAVTTFAGTSPTASGLARNNANTASNPYSQVLLDSLLQVGEWGYFNMPAYTKVNDTYLNSTFPSPQRITTFNGKIYVTTNPSGVKQLSNGYVTDFSCLLLFV
jgi:hypothetical protein